MYAEFFGLRELPFNITPDPRFLYLNDCYQEALAALAYGIDARKGFISLIGEAGTGKTTLLRRLLDTLGPSTKTVLLLNPTVSFDEILEHILLELGVPCDGGRKLVLLQRLNEFLIEHTSAGGNVALLIDEAQDLRPDVLEELRLLSNLETAREKILQIVLAGQPELDETLADTGLRQLRQRVTLRIRIRPLSPVEVAAYVRSRLERAGATRGDLFGAAALERVAALTGGIPRLVNVLCDATLLAALAAGTRQVTPALVEEAWNDYATEARLPYVPVTIASPEPPPAPAPEPVEVEEPPAPPAVAAPPSEPEAPAPSVVVPPPPPRAPRAEAAMRVGAAAASPAGAGMGIPVAAAVIAVFAVALSVLSVRQEWVDLDVADDGRAAASASAPGLAAVIEATAAEPPPAPAEGTEQATAVASDGVSSAEAAALIDEFRAAYEARDADRLVQLFAPDASENGVRGVEAIASSYRDRFPRFTEVRYAMPRFSIEAQGARVDVRGPFVISYRETAGATGEIRGQAEWALERRAGRARIVALNYRLDPQS